LPAGCADLCIADPPYCDTSLEWDKVVDGWLREVAHALKPNGSIWLFGSRATRRLHLHRLRGQGRILRTVWGSHP